MIECTRLLSFNKTLRPISFARSSGRNSHHKGVVDENAWGRERVTERLSAPRMREAKRRKIIKVSEHAEQGA